MTQPKPLVPVTVYCVVEAGDTDTLDPLIAPGFHVYVVAPEPVNEAGDPMQIAVGEVKADITGSVLTVKLIVPVLTQPLLLVPVTV